MKDQNFEIIAAAQETWNRAEVALRDALDALGVPYEPVLGEAAASILQLAVAGALAWPAGRKRLKAPPK